MSSLFGYINEETPKYTVFNKHASYEFRQYEKQIRAIVTFKAGSAADGLGNPFRALAGYIFGGNQKQDGSKDKIAMTAPVVTQQQSAPAAEKIAMTAPVVTQTGSGAADHTMAFILPSKYTSIADLPTPKNAEVKFEEVPPAKVVAIKFNGMLKPQMQTKEQALRAAAQGDGYKLSEAAEDVQYCQYNPPWCLPWCRTNEILIKVVAAPMRF